jgi:hypothetical protein
VSSVSDEDAQAEGDQCHEVQVKAEAVADECEDDRRDRVDQEPADEDAIVVDPVELSTDRAEDRVEGGKDRHRRITAELEADVDVEDESCEDAHQEPQQG